jgi:hypothetical protein
MSDKQKVFFLVAMYYYFPIVIIFYLLGKIMEECALAISFIYYIYLFFLIYLSQQNSGTIHINYILQSTIFILFFHIHLSQEK